MELFKLLGKIAITGVDEANKQIDNVTGNAENSGSKLGNAFGKIGGAAVKVGKVIGTGVAIGATAIGGLAKSSVDAYASYEQLVGGVETLFKDSSNTVMEYANNAYKTAGLSANQYMETVTSFSASLLQSLDGDTAKAADKANTAIIDMSDNANKMGTSMESIQNAYQGFAKQNYTMLDNLKLGYGGTKEEMQRLLEDAEKISGIEYDISSFSDIVDAIHVVQDEMGITGTTAKESSSTIEGSVASMKSAWTNLVTGIADENQNLDALIDNFVSSAGTAIENIIPRLEKILGGIGDLITKIAPIIADKLPAMFEALFPGVISGAISLITGLVDALPALLEAIMSILPMLIEGVAKIFNGIIEALPQIMETFVAALPTLIPQLVTGLVSMVVTLIEYLPDIIIPIIEYLPEIIQSLVDAIVENLPILIEGCIQLVIGIVEALPQIIVSLIEAIPTVIAGIVEALLASAPALFEGAVQLFGTITEALFGINEKLGEAWEEIRGKCFEKLSNIKADTEEKFGEIKAKVLEKMSKIKEDTGKKWQEIKDSSFGKNVSSILSNVKEKFGDIANKIKEKMGDARENVKNAIDKIKSFFKFEWSLPKLKLPHFSISGSFSLDPPSVPSFGIEWYKKGAILKEPTAFGMNLFTGKTMAGGEAGDEAVAPVDILLGYIRQAVAEQNNVLASILTKILDKLDEFKPNGDGDIIIPIYFGNELWDEIIIKAKSNVTLRSGGMADA